MCICSHTYAYGKWMFVARVVDSTQCIVLSDSFFQLTATFKHFLSRRTILRVNLPFKMLFMLYRCNHLWFIFPPLSAPTPPPSHIHIHTHTHTSQSYTESHSSPYDSLSPMDDVAGLPSPTAGVNPVVQVSSSVEGGVLQPPISTSM